MPTLLHIDSSPLYGRSVSRELTAAFVTHWQASYPDGRVVDRDLNATAIPPITAEWVGANYTPEATRTPQQREQLSLSDSLLAELEQANEYIIGVPMHNFGVPSVLKLWIDQIARVGRTFAYVDGNESGHTHIDGPTEATHLEDTEKNKSFMREYYESFHISGDHSRSNRYFQGDLCIRHEPGVRDGVAEFMRDVEVLMQRRTIDEVKILLGQGDFVFIAAKGTHVGDPCVYIDLYRVEDQKIVEHWGFPEMVPPQDQWKKDNGML